MSKYKSRPFKGKIKISEIFKSVNGETPRVGKLSIWARSFLCSLQCDGFGQKDPTNPDTYVLPYQTFDVSSIKKLEDLPVFEYGCDSSYSWSARYKNLVPEYTPEEIVDKWQELLPGGVWFHPTTKNGYDLCLTGGEPMMHQEAWCRVIDVLLKRSMDHGVPECIQFETNGTIPLIPEFAEYVKELERVYGITVIFNCSHKLWTVAGEPDEKAWFPEIIESYADIAELTQKVVVNGTQECWDELARKVAILNDMGVTSDVFVMPAGASKERQEDVSYVKAIAEEAISRGYHISPRFHATLFGNSIGT